MFFSDKQWIGKEIRKEADLYEQNKLKEIEQTFRTGWSGLSHGSKDRKRTCWRQRQNPNLDEPVISAIILLCQMNIQWEEKMRLNYWPFPENNTNLRK